MKRYYCEKCESSVSSKAKEKTHCRERVRNAGPEGQWTPPEVVTRVKKAQDVVGQNFDPIDPGQNSLTQEFLNDDAELTRVNGVGSTGSTPSTLSSSEEKEPGQHFLTPGLPAPEPVENPRAQIDAAISYISSRTNHLNPWQRNFFLGVRFNDRALSMKQRAILFEIEAVIRGYEAEDEAWREENQRAQHHLKKKEPGHVKVGCRYCDADAALAARAQQAYDEDMAWIAERIAEKEAKGLDAPETSPKPRPVTRTLWRGRSSQGTPDPLESTPKGEGSANA